MKLLLFCFTPVETSQEDSSDDNRSNSLGRSAPSDDVSVASDYQEEGAQECEYRVHLCTLRSVRFRGNFSKAF